MCDLGRVPPPHLGEDDGPDTHEDSKEDGGAVIKQILGLSHQTGRLQLVEVTELITARTHCRVRHLLADIHSWHVTGVSTANNIHHQSLATFVTCDTLVRGEGELASLLQPLPVDEVVARGVGHHHVHLHSREMVGQG